MVRAREGSKWIGDRRGEAYHFRTEKQKDRRGEWGVGSELPEKSIVEFDQSFAGSDIAGLTRTAKPGAQHVQNFIFIPGDLESDYILVSPSMNRHKTSKLMGF
jgi:hypothetical protein